MPEAPTWTTNPRYAWYVVAVLTLANISGNIDQQILSYLVRPLKRDFGVSDVQISYLIGLAFALFFTILGLPIARLADRSSRRNIMAGGVTLWSIFTSLCAAAKTYGALLLMRVGVGVGEASLNAPSVSLLSDYFPRERLGRAMSVYSMGIFLGSGAAYAIGGSIVGLLGVAGSREVPLLGAVHPWQLVFLAVGLPGLALGALILFTVREPKRQATASQAQLPLAVLYRYVGANRRTFLTHGLGFAMSALVNFSIVAWLPTFLIRTYGWDEGQAGRVQGGLTATVGVAGVLCGGWLSDRLVNRGKIDGPLRVGMIGAAGMLVAASAYPLMPSAVLAVAWLAVVNFFAALPWGAASAAAAEMVPSPLRAQGVALYFLTVSLISRVLGPTSVALFNDHVFGEQNIRFSLVVVNVLGMSAALVLFTAGLASYRRTLVYRETWTP